MKEIERKYLVSSQQWKTGLSEADSSFIQQGYLNADPDRVVRVRIRDTKAWITIKSRPVGISRTEFEYQIPIDDAKDLLKMCLGNVLVKRRYEISYNGNLWEVDEFIGSHDGLVLAEIELKREDQKFEKPDWLGEEVTHDSKFSNMVMAME
jgi:adenylate cyclase